MLLTLTRHAPNAADIGYVLGKNPASVFQREFSGGVVWAFYPEVSDEHVTIALVTEIDPIALVRGPAPLTHLGQYINDRPYVASSLTSVALRVAFSSALSGKGAHDERDTPARWVVKLPAVACDAGEEMITRILAPLGYAVTVTQAPLDARFPQWGPADIYSVTLEGETTAHNLLSHLYVLLPVLDNTKHYYVGDDESEKLLAHGGEWLAGHPERELIARRYLRYKRPLVESALARLAERDPALSEAEAEAGADQPSDPAEQAQGLHEQRLNTVMAAIREVGARSLADLGCGEGRLLTLAMRERELTRLFGMDVSSVALARAARRLHVDSLSAAQRARLTLAQGSLLYRDERLAGFDVAALVEVIEHLDAARLNAMERVVFHHAQPKRVIVTTPNRDYNVHWEAVGEQRLRHHDHRFEWTRTECQAWAERVARTYRYRAVWQGIGPEEPDIGAPSQMVIFDRDADAADTLVAAGTETVRQTTS
ncbi:MAG TPA: 3' terminal RNA ribose 2'-O-methyltransferase Hen1 [Ktedonobacterales bacterium]|nr:3' terminal RNA ribose 2'-O-methyltransferase Hen1 [Ktedonobacterales bacterium]